MRRFVKDLVMLSTLLLLVPVTLVILDSGVEAQDVVAPTLYPTTLHLLEGMELNPLPPKADAEYQEVTIPNGFIRDGFRGIGLLPVGHTYWKDVGTWYTQPMKQQVVLGGGVTAIIYATVDSGSIQGNFIFEILSGNEVLLSLYVSGQSIREGQDALIRATGAFSALNDTKVEAGTAIAFRVKAQFQINEGNGAATLKFAAPAVDSGVSFDSNSLLIHDVRMDRHNLIVEYKDAFLVPWNKLYSLIQVNKVDQPNEQMSSMLNSMNGTREIYWERDSPPGEYELFVTVGYSTAQNVSKQTFLKVPQHKTSFSIKLWAFVNAIKYWVLFGVFAIIVLFLVSRRRKKIWAKRFRHLPADAGESAKEKKRTWRNLQREKRLKRRLVRIKDTSEDDEENPERKRFMLFKRKSLISSKKEVAEEKVDGDELDL